MQRRDGWVAESSDTYHQCPLLAHRACGLDFAAGGENEGIDLLLEGLGVVLARLFQRVVSQARVAQLALEQRAVIPGVAEADALVGCMLQQFDGVAELRRRGVRLYTFQRLHHEVGARAAALLSNGKAAENQDGDE